LPATSWPSVSFDAIQVLENARLTGTLKVDSDLIEGSFFSTKAGLLEQLQASLPAKKRSAK